MEPQGGMSGRPTWMPKKWGHNLEVQGVQQAEKGEIIETKAHEIKVPALVSRYSRKWVWKLTVSSDLDRAVFPAGVSPSSFAYLEDRMEASLREGMP